MLYKQETGLAGQETEYKRTGHRVYRTVIQKPTAEPDTQNTTINTRI